MTLDDLERQMRLFRDIEAGRFVLATASDFELVAPHVRKRLVSIYTDNQGVIRARLKDGGRRAIEATEALIASWGGERS